MVCSILHYKMQLVLKITDDNEDQGDAGSGSQLRRNEELVLFTLVISCYSFCQQPTDF